MASYNDLLRQGAELLSPLEERYGDPLFEAKELLAFLAGSSVSLHTEAVPADVENRYFSLIERRLSGEPLQYLIGEWDFYGLTFSVGEGVLIPRADTELIVELALKLYKNSDSIKALDLCAGSGCIGLALEMNMKNRIGLTFIEKSEAAFEYLKRNMERTRSKGIALKGDVLDEALSAQFCDYDLIVCNPPYLTTEDMEQLQEEVTHEPPEALFGGDDGLDLYRGITRLWKTALKPGGALIYETGWTQAGEVTEIMIQHGFRDVRRHLDAEGRGRAVCGFKR